MPRKDNFVVNFSVLGASKFGKAKSALIFFNMFTVLSSCLSGILSFSSSFVTNIHVPTCDDEQTRFLDLIWPRHVTLVRYQSTPLSIENENFSRIAFYFSLPRAIRWPMRTNTHVFSVTYCTYIQYILIIKLQDHKFCDWLKIARKFVIG